MKWIMALILSTCGIVQAATWYNYARDEDGGFHDYEHSMITHHEDAGKVLVVWARTRPFIDTPKTSKYELHCPSRSYRVTHSIRVTRTGDVYQIENPQGKWLYAVPDSVEMVLIEHCCANYQ